tara:strand:+ start:214 stop:633 length:420 start_codon:yes stop_codon:yes gene_type:complete
MADGRLGKCKDCNKNDSIADYRNKSQDVDWFLKERRRSREKFHRLNYGNKYPLEEGAKYKNSKRYLELHPERRSACGKVRRAILSGKLTKLPCEICGVTAPVQAHHDDYSKPLDVRWLCVKHHNEYHVKKREAELLEAK